MDRKLINQILLRMGGNYCNISHLTKKDFAISDIQKMVDLGYLKFSDDRQRVIKTEQGRCFW